MNINKDNYEIWFLDYAEGNLDENQRQELFEFLKEHPALKNELDEFEIIEINQFETEFPNKNILKKTAEYSTDDFIAYHEEDLSEKEKKELEKFLISDASAKKEFDQLGEMYLLPDENVDFSDKDLLKSEMIGVDTDQLIAYHEGDLNEKEKKAVLTLISKNPRANQFFNNASKVFLTPDLELAFPDKAQLKKKETLIIPLLIRYAAIAASLLLVVSLFFLSEDPTYKPRETFVDNENDPVLVDEPIDSLGIPFKTILPEEGNSREELYANKEDENSPNKVNSINSYKSSDTEESFANSIAVNNNAPNNKEENQSIRNVKFLEIDKINALDVASNFPGKLKGNKAIPAIELPSNDDANIEENFAESNPQTNNSETTTLLAFAEEKAAQVVTGEKNKKLRLFDVIKKVGDKSRLYDLNEKENNQFTLKVLNIEMEGKRRKVSL